MIPLSFKRWPAQLAVSLCVVAVLAACSWQAARGADLPPQFTLDSSLSSLTIEVGIQGSTSSDTTALGGTIDSVLSFDTSAATPLITGLGFTGGRVSALDSLDFDLTILSFFNIHIDADNVAGQFSTRSPPAPIASQAFGDLNYAFDASSHRVDLNEGTLSVSGAASGSLGLAEFPLGGSPQVGTQGSLNLTQGTTVGGLTRFDAQLTTPIQFTNLIPFDTGGPLGVVDVNVQATGQIVANSMFELDIGLADAPGGPAILSPTDGILAIDLDGDSAYPPAEPPQNAIDGLPNKYLNFGRENAGFIVSPGAGSSVVRSFQITTADDATERDPRSWALFGTNDPITSADNSLGDAEAWTLIDSGAVSLPESRDTPGPLMAVDNSDAFASYRMVFPGVKNAGVAGSVQIGEVQFFGEGGITGLPSIFLPGDPIIAVDTDGDSSYPGEGSPAGAEPPAHAIDGTLNKHLNFGENNAGFIATPSTGGSVVKQFRVTTANDFIERDPTSWELFGTNDPITSADNSAGNDENWSLIDSGPLTLTDARDTLGPLVSVANDAVYKSYRLLFTGVKDGALADSVQYAEVEFFGEVGLIDRPSILAPGDAILAIDTGGNSAYPSEESPANAIDGTLDKYLNFGEVNAGFIVTPAAGSSVIESFQLTTANDAEGRDPDYWQLFGTNDAILSADNSAGDGEQWILIDEGALALPSGRDTLAQLIDIEDNTAPYSSYRLIFTDLKGGSAAGSMQIAEVQFYGEVIGLPGDFNGDGFVDAADYTVWHDGLGTTFVQADYAVWSENYGRRLSASLAVPEPTSLVAATLMAALVAGCHARRCQAA